jgi:hypothetical protein
VVVSAIFYPYAAICQDSLLSAIAAQVSLLSEIAFHVSDVSVIGVQVSELSEIAVHVSGVSFSLIHFNAADTVTLDIASIVPVAFVIALIVQFTFDSDWILTDINMTDNADALTLLTASDDADTFLNNIAALDMELCEAIVDATFKITMELQLASD